MKKLFIILVLNLLMVQAFAQAPGYMGKRFAVKYNLNAFPTFKHTANDYETQQFAVSGFNGLNLMHEGVLEYAAFRKSTIGVIVSKYKTGFDYRIHDNYNYYENHKVGMINQTGVGAFFRAYNGGNLAFVGKYFQMDCSIINSKIHLHDKPLTPISVNGFVAGMTFGTQKILFNRLIYEVGFRTSIAVNSGISENREEVVLARKRVMNAHVLSIKFGLGSMLF